MTNKDRALIFEASGVSGDRTLACVIHIVEGAQLRRQLAIPESKMVETGGIEPPAPRCDRDVFPLHHVPTARIILTYDQPNTSQPAGWVTC